MRAMVIKEANGPFVMEERPIPEPAAGWVRIKVEACGICHSDAVVKTGGYPGLVLPRVPGHEVTGIVDALGDGVDAYAVGDKVGVGWHGGHCFKCDACRRGRFINCVSGKTCGINYDGGYQEYMVAPHEALARIPEGLSFTQASPLLCAGITTFNSLRNSGARPGDVVAIQGIGGLGHLAVQFARQMGFCTVALSRGQDKRALAEKLGAHHYVDTEAEDAVSALKKLGGADLVLATAPHAASMAAVIPALSSRGKLMIVAAAFEPMTIQSFLLLSGRQIHGWPSGTAIESEDTMRFSVLTDVRAAVEEFPLAEANEAYARMMENKVRFRAVLTMS